MRPLRRRGVLVGVRDPQGQILLEPGRSGFLLARVEVRPPDALQQLGQELAVRGRRRQIPVTGDDGVDERLPRANALDAELGAIAVETDQVRRLRDQLGEPGDSILRARNALDELARRDREAHGARVRLEARLDDLRSGGLWEKLGQKEAEEQMLMERVEKGGLDADAIKQLHLLMQQEQGRAVDLAVRPVRERVERMMRQVLGTDVWPEFGDELLPGGLRTAHGANVDFDHLSAGTQDQLALLTRLALGELYAAEKGRHAFVLDDPLVNTHRERRNRIVELLVRASKDLQILIFTCHPEHYLGLPPDQSRTIHMDDTRLRPS